MEFLINTVADNIQRDPQVTVLSDGRFVVVWEDAARDQIGARAFSADGVALGDEFQVNTTSVNGSPSPSVTALSNGGFAVAYETENYSVVVQAFGASLERLGGEVPVKADADNDSNAPIIVAMQGRYAVFFEGWGDQDGVIRAQIFNNDGTGATEPVVIAASATNKDVSKPIATMLVGGQTVIAWVEETRDAQGKSTALIKAQMLNADGSKLGGELIVKSSGLDGSLQKPAITQLADGGFAIAYFAQEDGFNSKDLYIATFKNNGERSQSDLFVERVYPSGGAEYSASLASLDDGRLVVSWSNYVSDFDNNRNGIHGQIIDPRQKAVKLEGSAFNDHYVGTRFNDSLKGAAGDDRLEGGLGKDTFTGGTGKDVFIFRSEAAKLNKDKIVDFKTRDDSIWLDNSVLSKLGKKGTDASPAKLSKAFFTIGEKAKDKNDYLVYDKNKGVLYYDADGSGAGKAVEIATLTKKLPMTYKDFFVI
ncbi:calcium-binding protein [Microvirga aerilata]|uniref:Calcium-binding protein n=1 Tax=Microvirga aerilata TaxID=670292 RepID=A0A936ZEU0_9HYPH|nr:calcium-binding protein [Microvirga aerilata]